MPAIAVVLLVVPGAAFYLSLAAMHRGGAIARDRDRVDVVARHSADVLKLVLDLETGQRGYLVTEAERFLDPWRAARPRLPHTVASLERAASLVDEGPAARRIGAHALGYLPFSERIVGIARSDPATARSIVNGGEGKRRVDRLRELVERLNGRMARRLEARRVDAERAVARAEVVGGTGLVLSALLVASLLAYLGVAVLRPVRRTATAARALRSGHLSARVPPARTHELGELAAAFNDMADTLERNEAELLRRNLALQAARREADAANRAKSEFLSRMSHELRTPLNAILGFAQLLEMDDLDPDQRDGIRHIGKAGRHLLELINEVLDVSRIESGQLNLSLEPVGVGDLLQEGLAMIAPLARARSVTLTDDTSACGDVHALADRQRLKQVVLNLLANAVKYNRSGGDVRVGCDTVESGRLRLVVSDTGIGIAEHDLDRLFLPFERLNPEDARVEGTGLGLALTKRLVDAMGGEMGVESEPGAGSVFWVELDVVEAPVARPGNTPLPAAAPAPLGPGAHRTVLYIEDNLSNLKLVETILARRGAVDLLVAMQARLGLELALEHRPSLILLDLDLPDMRGDEVLRRLRADAATAATPIVVLSADATPGQMERLRALGATDYLTKPFDVARLLAAVEQAGAGEPAPAEDSAEPPRSGEPPLDPGFLRILVEMHGSSADQGRRVEELVRIFIEDGATRLRELRAAAREGDVAALGRLAHALTGSGGSVGARSLVRSARALDAAVKHGARDFAVLVDRVAAAHAEACRALEEVFPGQGPSRDRTACA